MNNKIEEIKKLESNPKIIRNIFDKNQINKFIKLYEELPTTVHNKKQNVIKKRWLKGYSDELESLFKKKLKNEIGEFKMDNLKDEKGEDILGLIQESHNPIGLHVDAGFNNEEVIYKQTLIPLSPVGSTVVFKNKFYGNSTSFTIDSEELKIKNLKYGQNLRSAEHLNIYNNKLFDKEMHKKYLKHENINNLSGMEIDIIYEWEIGSMLIFDRTRLHCSSSKIDGKKIGIATFTKK